MPMAASARPCASAWSTTPPPKDHEYGTTIPTFIRARLQASPEQPAECHAREQELRLHRHTRAVSAAAAMEDLLSPRTEPREDVLEIRRRAGSCSEHDRIEQAAASSQQAYQDDAAADLEGAVGDVLVRDLVAGDMQHRPEEERKRSGADEGAGCAPDRHVERDDQRRDHRVCSRGWDSSTRSRKRFKARPASAALRANRLRSLPRCTRST